MVGTAVYQLGLACFFLPKKINASKPGAPNCSARTETGQHGRNQSMDIKKRHDIHADVFGCQDKPVAHILCRCRHIHNDPLPDFWAQSRARRMQNQRNIARLRWGCVARALCLAG